MDPPTAEEHNLIRHLRDDVSDLNLSGYFDSDSFYLRWIRARESQLPKAEEMLRKSTDWRIENNIDSVANWEPECSTVPVDYPLEVCGFSKIGCPIVLIPFSYWDITKGIEAGLRSQMVRYIDQALENVETIMIQRTTLEKPCNQMDLVFDMNNLSFWQLASMKTIETILEIVRSYEANHPEILHRAYVINASRMFFMLFNIVKPFLSPRTLDKVRIFSAQQNQWVPELLKNIDTDQLPEYMGGYCPTSLKMYQSNERTIRKVEAVSPYKNFTTITINPEEKVLLTFDITAPNSKLTWEFRTDYYDIELCVYEETVENKPIVARDRFPSWLIMIRGEVTCKSPGQYIAEFNNTYSDIRRAKTLHYNFRVLSPDYENLYN